MRIMNYEANHKYLAPIYGAGADVKAGSLLKRTGAAGTSGGALVSVAAGACSSTKGDTNVNTVGILKEMLDYSVDGENLVAGTAFVNKPVDLLLRGRVVRIQYDNASASLLTCTQSVSTTTLTLTNLEDDLDGAFLYVQADAAGASEGQTNYLVASTGGSCTLYAAFGTNLSTDSKIIIIKPRFHDNVSINADWTKLSSVAKAGGQRCIILDSFIDSGTKWKMARLDPTLHRALTGLSTSSLNTRFFADIIFVDLATTPLA